ncbi:hypothetical protein IMZ48_04885 [Candidatus Bathyarchaeota archaeon]|nr:hypothetical protein [Candidatus Bathyarchaeota archaeon]
MLILDFSLNDHSVFSIMARTEPEFSTSGMSANFTSLRESQDEFYANSSGQYTAPSGITNGFQALSEEELHNIGAGDVVKEGLVNQAHIEYLYESIWYPGGPTPYYTPMANESYISLTASSLVALSRGNVTLRSSMMSAPPIINPNVRAFPCPRPTATLCWYHLFLELEADYIP